MTVERSPARRSNPAISSYQQAFEEEEGKALKLNRCM